MGLFPFLEHIRLQILPFQVRWVVSEVWPWRVYSAVPSANVQQLVAIDLTLATIKMTLRFTFA